MKHIQKILIVLVSFSIQIMNSQTTSNYIKINIQPHLQNKFWSSSENDSNKVVLHFTENQIHLYSFGKKFASDQYYITNNSCEDNLHSFEIEKFGLHQQVII